VRVSRFSSAIESGTLKDSSHGALEFVFWIITHLPNSKFQTTTHTLKPRLHQIHVATTRTSNQCPVHTQARSISCALLALRCTLLIVCMTLLTDRERERDSAEVQGAVAMHAVHARFSTTFTQISPRNQVVNRSHDINSSRNRLTISLPRS